MTSLSALSQVKVKIDGARGPIGLEVDGELTPGQFVVINAGRKVQSASGTGADAGLRTDLAAANGAALSGTSQGAGTPARSVQTVLRERVTTAGFGNDGAALQKAIDTGAREVIVNNDITITAPVRLRSGQVLRNAGGKLVVPATAQSAFAFPNAVLFNDGPASAIRLIGIIIDASALSTGAPGIYLKDVTGATIENAKLTKCNLLLESADNTISRSTSVTNLTADLQGYGGSALYLSGIRDVTVTGGDLSRGGEGVGIYNAARSIRLIGIESHDHIRDGFVVIAGHQIEHTDCRGHSNGQSGFTTQRQTAADNTRFVSYKGCRADSNEYDGFDLRGANDDHAPWDRDAAISASDCSARLNKGCGFYIVRAQGTKLANCTAVGNEQQNLLIDTSDRVNFSNFQSLSGAIAISSGTNKAGVTIYNSNMVRGDLVSGNWETEQQDWGASITGTSTGCAITGGDLSNNTKGPFVVPIGNTVSGVSGADTAGAQGYRFDALTSSGAFRETGVGIPSHFRPKGSLAIRTDGGGGEAYISNGSLNGNPSWSKLMVTA